MVCPSKPASSALMLSRSQSAQPAASAAASASTTAAASGGLVRAGGHQAALDRERPDAGQDVAAVLPAADGGLVQPQLQGQVVDVGTRVLRRPDDGDLAGQRRPAAEAVDLPGVGRADEPQQQVVAGRGVRGQVARLGVQAARGAAASIVQRTPASS
jgi:hypothetical protein